MVVNINHQVSMIQIGTHKGCLVLKGEGVDQIGQFWKTRLQEEEGFKKEWIDRRVERDGTDSFHLTVMHSSEVKGCGPDLYKVNVKTEIVDIGVGHISKNGSEVWFVVVDYPQGDLLREQYKLEPKDFHITLAFTQNDVHDVGKGLDTLMLTDRERITQRARKTITPKITELGLRGEIDDPQVLIKIGCVACRDKIWRIVSMVAEPLIMQGYLAGAYFRARYVAQRTGSGREAYGTLIHTLTGESWFEWKERPFSEKFLKILNASIGENLGYNKNPGWFSFEKASDKLDLVKQVPPRNFSFVLPYLAGSGMVSRPEYCTLIEKLGITQLITLCEEPLPKERYVHTELQVRHFPIDDRTPPTVGQLAEICEQIKSAQEEGGKTLVHCVGGIGRTATIIVGYIMWDRNISRQEAEKLLTNRRTQMTPRQTNFLGEWYGHCAQLAKRDPKSKLRLTKLPNLIVMIGYPASGKSTLATTLAGSSDKFVRVNQDEIRTKGKCEEMVGKYAKKNGCTVILDRCNLTRAERSYWIGVAHNPQKIWAIYFDIDPEECKYRIARRKNHPTVKSTGGARIIDSLAGKLEPPTKGEGFEKIHTITSIEESNDLMRSWGLVPPESEEQEEDDGPFIVKYPRTHHLINLGAATREDLIMDKSEAKKFYGVPVIVEEKIDGANLGISITKDYQVRVQNRSHYVNAKTHPQFKPLGKWVSDHTGDLFKVLEPGRHILYGEWVHAKHAIGYDQLPSWFIAFDLYDKREKKFVARPKLEQLLADTSIKQIPKVYEGVVKTKDELLGLMGDSNFYDGPMEGLVVRICDQDWLLHNGKVVRSDFICGNEHWAKGILTPNKLIY